MTYPIRPVPLEELHAFLTPIFTALGVPITPELVERMRAVPEFDVRLGAYEGEKLVGAAGSYSFDLSVPGGGTAKTAGLTLVGVLPTHRRRGILRSLMRRHLDDAHERGQPLAALYASEAVIYGRFGYGMASLSGSIDLPHEYARFLHPVERVGRAELVDEEHAVAAFPPVYERVRQFTPGMPSRSEPWWRTRRLSEIGWLRDQLGPLNRVLIELDGRVAAYALYRVKGVAGPEPHGVMVAIMEAMGDSPAALSAIWHYLLELDLAARFVEIYAPADHPLLLRLAEPRRLGLRLWDGLWLRLVDVERALSLRRYPTDMSLVVEISDAFCPWNAGRYRIRDGAVERTRAAPELSLDVQTLGSLYLGGFSPSALALAGRIQEHAPGALARADVLLHGARAPWCPEQF